MVKTGDHDSFLQSVFDATDIAIFVIDIDDDGGFRYNTVNAAWERLTGHSADSILGKNLPDKNNAYFQRCLKKSKSLSFEEKIFTGEKTTWQLTHLIPMKNPQGKIHRIIGTIIDITERKEISEKLQILSTAVDQNSSSIIIANPKGDIEYVNPIFFQLTGYTSEEVIGKNPRILKSGEHPPEYYQKLWQAISSGMEWKGEFHNKKKNGELYWESAVITPIKNETGTILHYVAIKEDITLRKETEAALKESEKKLKVLASTDPLTGVLNRRTGLIVLDKQIHLSRRNKKPLSIAFIDINGLKLVNDTYGHKEGDAFILRVCRSIQESVRNSDTLCRMGGDEFLIIFPECCAEMAESLNKRILEKLGDCSTFQQKPYACGFSFGIEEYSLDKKLSLDGFIERADKKMYEQKKSADLSR